MTSTESASTVTFSDILAGVSKDWMAILTDEKSGCKGMLKDILTQLITMQARGVKITPPLARILQFARTPFRRVRAVAIGQDPYPTEGDADGLAFSSSAVKCPASVARIFGALEESKLIPGRPSSWNLATWASQGICLMNTAWTTEVGQADAHKMMWHKYTTEVFRLMSERSECQGGLIWMLWGNHAQERASVIDGKRHQVLKYAHPVAMVKPGFRKCDHFAIVAKRYPEIVWHFDPIETEWSTDGSCKNNQKAAAARGAWGVVCRKGPLAGGKWGAALPKTETVAVGGGKTEEARPTNIRAEGKALIFVLKTIVETGIRGKHTIESDSKFWIEDMLEHYIPGWIEKGIKWEDKKNSDLTERMWKLWQRAKPLGAVFKFVNAWHDYTPTDEQRPSWEGNRAAEETAESFLVGGTS